MPTNQFTYMYVTGDDKVIMKLVASGNQTETLSFVMDKIVMDMMRVEEMLFQSQGRRGGGSWAWLKPDTIDKKQSAAILTTFDAAPGYVLDNMRDALFDSLTKPGAEYQVLEVTNTLIHFGTDRPWAYVHELGSDIRKIPARPFIRFTPFDLARWDRWFIDHIVEPFL